MQNRTVHLSKPLYEMLPYSYIAAGLVAIVCGYFLLERLVANVAMVLGVVCVIGGVVVLLRRRDARATRSEYPGGTLNEREL